MDRRSWLWRRKSSEKSPTGETESSGSISSHSERFSDDQTSSNHINIQSKAEANDESVSEKLSEALVNIRAKEDLVKQHAKVAEEAVSGWERAEKEVTVLKKQNEALTHMNLILEERVGHLDEALKECLRQHRQEEDKMHNSIQNANARLEAVENDKSILRLELEIRSRERDLSARAAEAATKQHVDTLKKVARLEAECLQLKARANDYLMDDFLEMEKLVEGTSESRLRDQVEELEGSLKKITAEKVRLEIRVKDAEVKLMQLALANEEAEKNLGKIQRQLKETNEAKMQVEEELEKSISRLEREVEREKNAVGKCEILEAEISRMKSAELRIVNEVDLDKQVAMAATKFAQCQKTIASLGRQLKSLATFDDFLLDSERQQVTVI